MPESDSWELRSKNKYLGMKSGMQGMRCMQWCIVLITYL